MAGLIRLIAATLIEPPKPSASFPLDRPLEVHHINGTPTDNRLANLIPLCRDCHYKATFPGIY